MDIGGFKLEVNETVIRPMLAYMRECAGDGGCGFSVFHVLKCKRLIFAYLKTLSRMKAPTDAEIMEAVKNLVLALNELNEKAEYALLETEERENICDIIQRSAEECGLLQEIDDVTEEWRDW